MKNKIYFQQPTILKTLTQQFPNVYKKQSSASYSCHDCSITILLCYIRLALYEIELLSVGFSVKYAILCTLLYCEVLAFFLSSKTCYPPYSSVSLLDFNIIVESNKIHVSWVRDVKRWHTNGGHKCFPSTFFGDWGHILNPLTK